MARDNRGGFGLHLYRRLKSSTGNHTGIAHQERMGMMVNWVFRAQPVPYDWVPEGTPHSENPVSPPELTEFRVR